jgi:hypothetical protein
MQRDYIELFCEYVEFVLEPGYNLVWSVCVGTRLQPGMLSLCWNQATTWSVEFVLEPG